jgi:hypothetical protein
LERPKDSLVEFGSLELQSKDDLIRVGDEGCGLPDELPIRTNATDIPRPQPSPGSLSFAVLFFT